MTPTLQCGKCWKGAGTQGYLPGAQLVLCGGTEKATGKRPLLSCLTRSLLGTPAAHGRHGSQRNFPKLQRPNLDRQQEPAPHGRQPEGSVLAACVKTGTKHHATRSDTERSAAQPASWEDVPKTAEPRERQGRHGLFPSLPRTGRSKHVCETSRPGMKPAPRGAEGGAVGLGGQGRGTGQASPTAGHGSLGLSLFGRDATSPGTRPASEAFPTAAGLTTPTVLGTART